MKFFKGRLVHNIYILVSLLIFSFGSLILLYSNDSNLIEGIGKVLFIYGGVLLLLLFLLYILPRRVFNLWKYISIPFLIYISSVIINTPVWDEECSMFCGRGWTVYVLLIKFVIITFSISTMLSIILYIIDKKRSNKK